MVTEPMVLLLIGLLYFDEIVRSDSTSIVASLADDINGNPVTYTFDDQATYYYPPPTGVDGARANIVNEPEWCKWSSC